MIGDNVPVEQVNGIADRTMREADRDGDGCITFHEFCKVIYFVFFLFFITYKPFKCYQKLTNPIGLVQCLLLFVATTFLHKSPVHHLFFYWKSFKNKNLHRHLFSLL